MEKMEVRTAVPGDIPALEALVNSAFRGESSRKGWTTEADLLEGIRVDAEALKEMMEAPNAVILTCYNDQQLIGCVYLQQQKDQLYLGMLTVDPGLQNRGTGKYLMQVAEDYARRHQCKAIVMNVLNERPELTEWYIRQGYYLTGEKKEFPPGTRLGTPLKQIFFNIMRKDLDQ